MIHSHQRYSGLMLIKCETNGSAVFTLFYYKLIVIFGGKSMSAEVYGRLLQQTGCQWILINISLDTLVQPLTEMHVE